MLSGGDMKGRKDKKNKKGDQTKKKKDVELAIQSEEAELIEQPKKKRKKDKTPISNSEPQKVVETLDDVGSNGVGIEKAKNAEIAEGIVGQKYRNKEKILLLTSRGISPR